MKFAVFAVLVAIALPAPAFTADWVLVSTAATGDKYYIDRQSVRTMPNGYKRAWEQVIYAQPDKYGDTDSVEFREYDCIDDRSRILSSRFYKNSVNTAILDKTSGWRNVAPETIAEKPFKFVCSGKR
jgi:hypothetical protein